jgi:hypothetical protein
MSKIELLIRPFHAPSKNDPPTPQAMEEVVGESENEADSETPILYSSMSAPRLINMIDDNKSPRGYPRLAAFASSHAAFQIYRSFVPLHTHLLQLKQAELSTLQQQLEELNKEDSLVPYSPKDRCLASHAEYRTVRDELLRDIETKLKDYSSTPATTVWTKIFADHRIQRRC